MTTISASERVRQTFRPQAIRPQPAMDRPVVSRRAPVMRAEAAECTCPEFCERDHTNE
jgi:hypothetical protein